MKRTYRTLGFLLLLAHTLCGCDFTEADVNREVQAALQADPHAVELDAASEKKVAALLRKTDGDADVEAFVEASMRQGRETAARMKEQTTDSSEAGRANRRFMEEMAAKQPDEVTPEDLVRVQEITGVDTESVMQSEQMQHMQTLMGRYPDLMTLSQEERQAFFSRLAQRHLAKEEAALPE